MYLLALRQHQPIVEIQFCPGLELVFTEPVCIQSFHLGLKGYRNTTKSAVDILGLAPILNFKFLHHIGTI